jgi:hypothetical protein
MWEALERWNAGEAAIRIRLGDDHPIYRAGERLIDAANVLTTTSEAGDQIAFDEGVKSRETALKDLVAEAVAEVGTKTS